jgi:hypothetical protein
VAFRIKMFENKWQKQLTNKGDYEKPLDVATQVKPLAAAIAQEVGTDATTRKNIRDHLEIAIDSAADKATGRVSVKQLGELAETMDLAQAITGAGALGAMKGGAEALVKVLIGVMNKGEVPAVSAQEAKTIANPEEHLPLSIPTLVAHLETQVKLGRLEAKDHDMMFLAAHLSSTDDGKTVTIAQVKDFAVKAKEYAEMYTSQNQGLRDAGMKPNVADLQKELSMRESHLGTLKLSALLLHSVTTGELAQFADRATPGATQALGGAFGGAR